MCYFNTLEEKESYETKSDREMMNFNSFYQSLTDLDKRSIFWLLYNYTGNEPELLRGVMRIINEKRNLI